MTPNYPQITPKLPRPLPLGIQAPTVGGPLLWGSVWCAFFRPLPLKIEEKSETKSKFLEKSIFFEHFAVALGGPWGTLGGPTAKFSIFIGFLLDF